VIFFTEAPEFFLKFNGVLGPQNYIVAPPLFEVETLKLCSTKEEGEGREEKNKLLIAFFQNRKI
jgi:hypothetical protein